MKSAVRLHPCVAAVEARTAGALRAMRARRALLRWLVRDAHRSVRPAKTTPRTRNHLGDISCLTRWLSKCAAAIGCAWKSRRALAGRAAAIVGDYNTGGADINTVSFASPGMIR